MKILENHPLPSVQETDKIAVVFSFLRLFSKEIKKIYEEIAIVINHNSNKSYPARVSQLLEPTPEAGELIVWHDSTAGTVYLVYNDATLGVVKVELT